MYNGPEIGSPIILTLYSPRLPPNIPTPSFILNTDITIVTCFLFFNTIPLCRTPHRVQYRSSIQQHRLLSLPSQVALHIIANATISLITQNKPMLLLNTSIATQNHY